MRWGRAGERHSTLRRLRWRWITGGAGWSWRRQCPCIELWSVTGPAQLPCWPWCALRRRARCTLCTEGQRERCQVGAAVCLAVGPAL